MNCILFDDPAIRTALLPFTFTRPVSEIRSGIDTITEKWRFFLQMPVSYLTEKYLQTKFPATFTDENLLINGAVCPDEALVAAVQKLKKGQKLVQENLLVAFRTDEHFSDPAVLMETATSVTSVAYPETLTVIGKPSDIFIQNGKQIRADFARITKGRQSAPVTDPHTRLYHPEQIFLEEGATTMSAVLNAQSGPIYMGKNAEVQEGCLVRGAFAICENSVLHMGGKMRGDNTIGPHCKVGGEITNSIFFGYSNKAHDGYLGNSVIGEWCNLGADTNTSNMKNDYGTVKVWSYAENQLTDTGLQFCGLLMGDHSKAGINTMFNTGTVVGVNVNVFGGDFPPKYLPSFSWGGARNLQIYQLNKALEVAEQAMQRRSQPLTEVDKAILTHVFEQTHASRQRIGFV